VETGGSVKSELARLKHHLFNIADDNDNMTRTDANVIISDANRAAYDSLDADEKRNIKNIGAKLQSKLWERSARAELGDAGQLELIAAIGAVLNEFGGEK
jgi:hypothetical protein